MNGACRRAQVTAFGVKMSTFNLRHSRAVPDDAPAGHVGAERRQQPAVQCHRKRRSAGFASERRFMRTLLGRRNGAPNAHAGGDSAGASGNRLKLHRRNTRLGTYPVTNGHVRRASSLPDQSRFRRDRLRSDDRLVLQSALRLTVIVGNAPAASPPCRAGSGSCLFGSEGSRSFRSRVKASVDSAK